MVETKHIFSTVVSSSVFYMEHNIPQVTLENQVVDGDTMTAIVLGHGQQEVGEY